MKLPVKVVNGERVEIPWEQSYGPFADERSMILCRTNAPLVSECFRFLKRGIKATILGKKIGEGLIKLVRKSETDTVDKLVGWLSDWYAAEKAKELAKRFPSEGKLQTLLDKYSCVVTFTDGLKRTDEVVRKIESVFADKKCPKCGKTYETSVKVCQSPACGGIDLVLPKGVRFSSIHKSKGLESPKVFILQSPSGIREDRMQDWELEQENHLRYVAITRAIDELVYVS